MRFELAHKLVTYLLVLATVGALGATGALSVRSAALFLVAAALSFPVDPGSRSAAAIDRAATAARLAALGLFALLLWRIWRGLPDPDYGPGFDLGLALLGYKLFHRRTHRDYVHLLAFSFVLVLVSATLAASFVFVIAFAIYVGLAIWTLILFHLRREMEENYLVKHSAQAPSQKVGVQRILGSRRVVGGWFFAATALVAAAVLTGGLAVFVVVPRFGAGFVLGGEPLATSALGSGEDMAIGRYGTAPAARHRVTLRVTVPTIAELPDAEARRRASDGLYIRGAVYDAYVHGRWSRSREPELGTLVVEDLGAPTRRFSVREQGSESLREPGSENDDRSWEGAARQELDGAIQQEIEAVGMPVSVLFAIDRAVAFELPAARLGAAGALRVVPRWSGEAALRVGGGSAAAAPVLADAHYVAFSLPRPALGGGNSGAGRGVGLTPAARNATLALPPVLAPGWDALAESVLGPLRADAGVEADSRRGRSSFARPSASREVRNPSEGSDSTTARIGAVVDWLRAHHGYAPEPPATPAGVDPVDAFVRGQQRGHCELFASAAVLLLRAAGVPARYVTGFRGGEWNGLGGYVAVRDDRAHAWAEAFVPDTGWVRVDATPAGPPPAPPGRLAELADALEYTWSRWMLGYDLPRQRELAHRAGRHLPPLGLGSHRASLVPLLLAGAALAALALGVSRLARRRTRDEGTAARGVRPRPGDRPGGGSVGRLYARTLARLDRAGWPRTPSETPHEYARRLRAAGLYPNGELDALTERYAAARFGSEAVDDAQVAALAANLAKAGSAAGHPGTLS